MIHFLHIGKTGGTAIRSALSSVDATIYGSVTFHGHATKLRDIPRGEKVIFFLRDPIARIVSGFYSRKREGAPRYRSPWSEEEKRVFMQINNPQDLVSFAIHADREKQLIAIEAMRAIGHVSERFSDWLESVSYLQSRREDLLFVGMLETLEHDFEWLKRVLRLDQDVSLPKSSREAHINPVYKTPKFTDAEKSYLRGWLCSDFRLHEYCLALRHEVNEEV